MAPTPGVGARVHAAAACSDGDHAVGFVVCNDARRPVALGGWRVAASDREEAVRKAAIAGLHRAPTADRVALHVPFTDGWRAMGRRDRLESMTGATVDISEPTPPEADLACGVAKAGLQGRLLYESAVSEVAAPVRVYADGSERASANTTAASYGIVDDRGRVIAVGATRLGAGASYLDGEYRGVAAGVRAAAALEVGRIHVFTDNQRVVAVLGGEVSPEEAVTASRDARRAVAAAMAAPGVEVRCVHETDRRYNRFADALAGYGHHRELSLPDGRAVNWW